MIIIYSKTKWQIQLLIHIAKQIINRNKNTASNSEVLLLVLYLIKRSRNNEQIIDNLTINPPNQRLLTIELLLLR